MSRPLMISDTDDRDNPHGGPTLLPAPVASLVSLLSKSTTVGIRLGTLLGEAILGAAKGSTLTSLELGKAVVEGVLVRAGQDIESRRLRKGEHDYAEGWTEKGIDFLHSTVSLTQLLVSTGFHLSSTTLSTVAELAQNYVWTLDSVFGSTESSRAISAIVALIRKEFGEANAERTQNRGPNYVDSRVGITDLIAGLTCFAVLQMRAKDRTVREIKMAVLWDAMVMDDGKSVSMLDDGRKLTKVKAQGCGQETVLAMSGNSRVLGVKDGDTLANLLAKLPPTAEVNISTQETTTQTTTIEIKGAMPPDYNPPSGAVVIYESADHGINADSTPSYKIVYQSTTDNINRKLRRKDGNLEIEVEDFADLPLETQAASPSKPYITTNSVPDIMLASSSPTSPSKSPKRRRSSQRLSSKRSILPLSSTSRPEILSRQPSVEFLETPAPSEYHSLTPDTTPNPKRRSLTRSKSQPAPSIYTLRTSRSQSSLLLQYPDNGTESPNSPAAKSTFPEAHLCKNMAKFVRFASASYGQSFMRMLGIGAAEKFHEKVRRRDESHHIEHHSFSYHTNLPVDTILLSSFTDPGGGYDASGETGTGVPLVHFVCVDHGSKAIVLTCRGTLGLEDVLTDLTCEYSDLVVRGKTYRVHKGMLNSALLLLRKSSRVLPTIARALDDFPTYGLVLCGHSLGGGVAAILSILLSQPDPATGLFVTSPRATSEQGIPSGRPIHCYAYGPPACVCPRLRLLTQKLITTVVFGADIVPSLSFGMIRDFYNVAVAFKEDTQGVMAEVRRRVVANLSLRQRVLRTGDDDYLFAILKTLRANMTAEKLVPPGEIYLVETQVVFLKDLSRPRADSDASSDSGSDSRREEKPLPGAAGGIRHATRITCRVVKDAERRFNEIWFGQGMFGDHSPKNYESALELLLRGVCEEEN